MSQSTIHVLQITLGGIRHKVHGVGKANTNNHVLPLHNCSNLRCAVTNKESAVAFGILQFYVHIIVASVGKAFQRIHGDIGSTGLANNSHDRRPSFGKTDNSGEAMFPTSSPSIHKLAVQMHTILNKVLVRERFLLPSEGWKVRVNA